MKIGITTFFFLVFFACSTFAATTATPDVPQTVTFPQLQDQHLSAKKPTLLQRQAWRIFEKKLKRKGAGEIMTPKQIKKAKWSMILGIGSLVLLLTPLAFLSLPAAIVGLVFGISSLKGNSNTNGVVGVITSGVTLLLFLLAIIIIALYFSLTF